MALEEPFPFLGKNCKKIAKLTMYPNSSRPVLSIAHPSNKITQQLAPKSQSYRTIELRNRSPLRNKAILAPVHFYLVVRKCSGEVSTKDMSGC
ncbi:hypothetical protein EAE99_010843 [Botrytis elliptica]|nr:hypothetical protein EAE99_010843 [Botrytis elliptica]